MLEVTEVQELIDEGYSVNHVASILGVHSETLRRFVAKHNIEIYVAFDEVVSHHATDVDLAELIYISDNFRVSIDEEKLRELQAVSLVDRRKLQQLINERKADAIDAWIRQYEPSEISNAVIGSNVHIDYYIRQVFGSYPAFRKAYGIDVRMLDTYDKTPGDIARRLGYEFESLVAEVLAELNAPRTPIASQASQSDGSRPDFVINNHAWVDAKLSRSTAFAPGCKTLDKYAKQAGTLTIIYAIKDCVRKDPRAEFVHVMSLVPLMSEALRDKTIAFVKKAKEVRYGKRNRPHTAAVYNG